MKKLQILIIGVMFLLNASAARAFQTAENRFEILAPSDTTQNITQAGNYRVTVRGADGGSSSDFATKGGSGATVAATFSLQAGDVLTLVTGIAGQSTEGPGGGGGGSAVILTRNGTQTLLIVAGGGGGRGPSNSGGGGISAQGTPGGGAASFAAGGGGFNSDGSNYGGAGGGKAGTLAGGGAGGTGGTSDGGYGFGGGGAASHPSDFSGGGGGGYGGGNGGALGNSGGGMGGSGGSSYVEASGTNVTRTDGAAGGGTSQNGSIIVSALEATITVNSTVDNGTNGCDAAECTLREAIAAAGSGDTIQFASPLFDSPQTITLTQGELAITGSASLTINGTGANRLSISGNNASRVFFIGPQATLTLNNLTVTGGKTGADNGNLGAGIYNNGTVTLTNSIVSGNSATGGGGIFNNSGTVTITNSTVSGNSAVGNGTNSSIIGGGVFNNSGNLTITNSTISGNFVSNDGGIGGGIFNGGEMTLTNSTVSGNTASAFGGGIFNATNSFLRVKNSTISGNTASSGGGIYNQVEGTLTLRSVTVAFNTTTGNGGGVYTDSGINLFNTIVAKNNGPASAPDFSGEISSHSSFNLIGNGTGMTGITNGSSSNQVGTSAIPIDPKLNPTLAPNGGTTQTHALLFGSPALDQGDDAGTDQRGLPRPVDLPSVPNGSGNAADIGAYEAQTAPIGTTAASVSISGRVMTSRDRSIANARVTLTEQNGETRTVMTNSFGYYRFDDIAAGQSIIISVTSKRFQFAAQVFNVTEEINELNFVSQP